LSAVTPLQRRIEVGELLPGAGALAIAADIFLPTEPSAAPAVLFCLPGGGMNRVYFNLQGEGDFSFAAHLVARGFIVVSLDHLGVGESSRPADGFALTPDLLAKANAIAVEALHKALRCGEITGQPLPLLPSIGVGHSMGAMLTAMQQAQRPSHAALVLFGFSNAGLVAALTPDEKQFAGDPDGLRANLIRLARLRGDDPYPQVKRSAQGTELFAGATADPRGVEALKPARASLLLTAGVFSMVPGSCAPESARISVPVFLALGDRDMAGPPHLIPASYPGSPDVTLLVLPATGHAHFIFPARQHLFERVAGWCEAMLPEG
jgi:alpha-beta hydrolase superfamily lysophospholipase